MAKGNKESLQEYFDILIKAHGINRAVQIIMDTLMQKDSGFDMIEAKISFTFRDADGELFIVTEKLGPESEIKLGDLLDLFMGR